LSLLGDLSICCGSSLRPGGIVGDVASRAKQLTILLKTRIYQEPTTGHRTYSGTATATGKDEGANHDLVSDFGLLFGVIAGRPNRIDEHRGRLRLRRYRIPRRSING